MAFRDDLVEPRHPITARATNDLCKTYWVMIEMSRELAGPFLRDMWESVDGHCFPSSDEQALSEWTDRQRDVRSTFSSQGVCIRTHAWTPEGDRNGLPKSIIEFLISRGLEV